MKTIVLIIIVMGMISTINAQPNTLGFQDSLPGSSGDSSAFHMAKNRFSFGLALGYPWSAGARISFFPWRDMGIGFGLKLTKLKSPERAVDFKKSSFNLRPGDILITYSVFFVKEFSKANKDIWGGIEVGVAFVDYVEARFDDQNIGSFMENFSSLGSSNYYIGYAHRYTLGMSYRFRLKVPFRNYTGLEMAIAGNLNMYKPYIGFEFGWTFSRRSNRINN